MVTQSMGAQVRRSERVLLKIPIRVEGKDILGNAFDETTHTLVVNQSGGLIVVPHLLELGTVIKITNLKNQISCSFQVAMHAAKSLSGTPEWGVKCLEPELDIWGVHFPMRTENPLPTDLIHVLLECQKCFSREMAALTVQQYRRLAGQSSLPRPCSKCRAATEWRFGFIEAEVEEVLPSLPAPSASRVMPQGGAEKRREKRLMVKLPLGVRLPNGSEETSITENISKSGLCFACNLEMQVGDRVYVSVGLESPEERRDIPARVMWRRPPKEKGRAFYGVKLEGAA